MGRRPDIPPQYLLPNLLGNISLPIFRNSLGITTVFNPFVCSYKTIGQAAQTTPAPMDAEPADASPFPTQGNTDVEGGHKAQKRGGPRMEELRRFKRRLR